MDPQMFPLDRSYPSLSSALQMGKSFPVTWVQIQENLLVYKNKGHSLSPWHNLEGFVSPRSELFSER